MPVAFRDLYPEQKTAVKHHRGPLLVLAGPGTGKTLVLTHRIAYLVNTLKVDPQEIMAATFSRKAAMEMSKRLNCFKGFEETQPQVSTLHAAALRTLGEMGSSSKYLLDNDEIRMLIMDAAEDIGLYASAHELKELKNEIELLKAKNTLPNEIRCMNTEARTLKTLYERYEELLNFHSAIDLSGLIMKVVRILSSSGFNPEGKIKHLLIDEYQDINQSEFEFIQILAKNVENLFVVGDDDQSIYGWRGADPNIIRKFEQDFQDAEVEILEKSHRCTDNILKGARAIVSKDPDYTPKRISSIKGAGSPIHILWSKSWTAEALWIADWIKDNLAKGLFRPRDIVILSKSPKLADFLAEEQLSRLGIDTVYWRAGGLFSQKIVRDILAHVRFIVDREDNLALRRCMKTPTGHGIGKKAVLQLRRIAEKDSCSFWEVLIEADRHTMLRTWRRCIDRFVTKIEQLDNKSSELKLDETIQLIAKELNASRLAAVDKLKSFAQSLSNNVDLEDFFSEVNKNRGLDLAEGAPEPEEEKDAVTIMSMHSAKGLQYDVVFLLGMDQGIMPDPTQGENEQRRLCYVAMTRAQKELFLCTAKLRKGPAVRGMTFYKPSRFLSEIPKEHRELIRNF